jgi:hypothetical protein
VQLFGGVVAVGTLAGVAVDAVVVGAVAEVAVGAFEDDGEAGTLVDALPPTPGVECLPGVVVANVTTCVCCVMAEAVALAGGSDIPCDPPIQPELIATNTTSTASTIDASQATM